MLESCEERQQCVLERKLHQWSSGGCFCKKKVRRVSKIKTLSHTISQPMVVILDLLCALGRTPRWIQFLEWRMTSSRHAHVTNALRHVAFGLPTSCDFCVVQGPALFHLLTTYESSFDDHVELRNQQRYLNFTLIRKYTRSYLLLVPATTSGLSSFSTLDTSRSTRLPGIEGLWWVYES